MADNETSQHREGEVLSTVVRDDGTIREDRWENGEVKTHIIDHEPVRYPGQDPQVAPDGAPIPQLEFESHREGPSRVVEHFRDEDGDMRTRIIETEPVFRAPPPEPSVVEITPTAELDAWVHQAAMDANPHPVEAMAEVVDPPVPTLEFESHVTSDGRVIDTYRDDDGDYRTRTIDTEPVAYAQPPVPTEIEFEVTTRSATHDADIEATPAHGDDGSYVGHPDGAGDDSAAHYGDATSAGGHEADHTVTSAEEGS